MDISYLRPFRGLHSSLLTFSTGHVFRISDWSASPTEFGAFSNLWMVTPQDRRLLFADPPQSDRVVRIYHDFHGSFGAHMSLRRPDPVHLDLTLHATDATSVEIHLRLTRIWATRLLIFLSRGMPMVWRTKDPMLRVLDTFASAFLAKGKLKVAGKTETGQPFFAADIDELFLVSEGSASVNGAAPGHLSPPSRPVAFGDLQTTRQSYLVVGRLYLPYQATAGLDARGQQLAGADLARPA